MAISLTDPGCPRAPFKSSPLCYACKTYTQYQVAVKLLGSFRLTAGNRHLHRYCIFTEQVPETVLQSLHHSCTSELHVLFPRISRGMDYIFIPLCKQGGSQRVVSTGSPKIIFGTSLGITMAFALGFTDIVGCFSFAITREAGRFRCYQTRNFATLGNIIFLI